jgi:hypothetical protein
MEEHMPGYRTTGTDLLDGSGSKVAMVRGVEIYDSDNNKIATLTPTEVYDAQNKPVAVLRGLDVYDGRDRKIATLSDIYYDIDSVLGGPALIGLWIFFVRNQPARVQGGPTVEESPTKKLGLFQRIFRFWGKSD